MKAGISILQEPVIDVSMIHLFQTMPMHTFDWLHWIAQYLHLPQDLSQLLPLSNILRENHLQ